MTELPRESDDSNKSADATESVTSQDTQNSVDPVEDVSDIEPEQPTPTYNRDASKTDKSARMKKGLSSVRLRTAYTKVMRIASQKLLRCKDKCRCSKRLSLQKYQGVLPRLW